MSGKTVSIIIPTFQRPDDLVRAARSVFGQTLLQETRCTLIIVDNDPARSADQVIDQIKTEAPANLTVISGHEPDPGVANARNHAMTLVATDLIVFLDDDQSAVDEKWLSHLFALYTDYKPAVCFGPLIPKLPETVTGHKPYFTAFFGRNDPSPRGLIPHFHGGCNTLIDISQLPAKRPVFDPRTNESGGEDDLLFQAIEANGGTFAWDPAASVYEHVPAARARLGYTLKRAFAYGQGPCTLARQDRDYVRLGFWIGVGTAKFIWHGARAAIGYLFGMSNRANEADLAIRGLAKVIFWHDMKLYGAATLRPSPPSFAEAKRSVGSADSSASR